MSIIPSFRRSSIFDPLKDFPVPSSSSLSTGKISFTEHQNRLEGDPEAHVVKADLPGLKKEEMNVEVEDDRILQISGEKNVVKEDKNDKWHRVERSSGYTFSF
ncbi:hypothetical protein CerSpe_202990 [Prunus speciosa]